MWAAGVMEGRILAGDPLPPATSGRPGRASSWVDSPLRIEAGQRKLDPIGRVVASRHRTLDRRGRGAGFAPPRVGCVSRSVRTSSSATTNRRHWTRCQVEPGAAWRRLRRASSWTIPHSPPPDISPSELLDTVSNRFLRCFLLPVALSPGRPFPPASSTTSRSDLRPSGAASTIETRPQGHSRNGFPRSPLLAPCRSGVARKRACRGGALRY